MLHLNGEVLHASGTSGMTFRKGEYVISDPTCYTKETLALGNMKREEFLFCYLRCEHMRSRYIVTSLAMNLTLFHILYSRDVI